MSFQVKKIADVGTENPVVARLSYQWFEIFRWFDLPPTRRNAVLEIMFDKCSPAFLSAKGYRNRCVLTSQPPGRKGSFGSMARTTTKCPRCYA